jgi:hypothetical protein
MYIDFFGDFSACAALEDKSAHEPALLMCTKPNLSSSFALS